MSIVDKLVYLIQQGAITAERVAPQYREAVMAAMGEVQDEELQ